MEKMSIHRGLAEHKMLDSRINKLTREFNPVGLKKKGGKVNDQFDITEFNKDAKAKLQSIKDLIDRKARIKSAIVKANCSTIITVGKVEMTIADAINEKTILPYKKTLAERIKQSLLGSLTQKERHNVQVDNSMLEVTKAVLNNQAITSNDDQAKPIKDLMKEAHYIDHVDPIKAQKEYEKMEDENMTFEAEIDAVLSEANAITQIEF